VSGPQETKSGPSINVSSPDDQPKNNFAANKAALNNLFIPGGGKPQKSKSVSAQSGITLADLAKETIRDNDTQYL